MSRESVRQAVANYLSGKQIPGVAVYPAEPRNSDPVPTTPGLQTIVIAFPMIASQEEHRLGMGKKQVDYTVSLLLKGYSTQPIGEDAQTDCDAIYESILDWIRVDPSLGTLNAGSPILQAGEGSAAMGGTDLRLEQDMPLAENPDGSGALIIWARLSITAVEIVNAPPPNG
ncbi:MAG: hypothetical protein WBF51_04245 [Candidatus Dormiibacterota bacterium]